MSEYLEDCQIDYMDDHVEVRMLIQGERYGFDIGYELFDQLRLTGTAPVVMELLVRAE